MSQTSDSELQQVREAATVGQILRCIGRDQGDVVTGCETAEKMTTEILALREELAAARAAMDSARSLVSHHPKGCVCVIHDYLARYPQPAESEGSRG